MPAVAASKNGSSVTVTRATPRWTQSIGWRDSVLRDANYVQRIMENLQVYRARFGGGTKLQIEADLHRGASVE